MFSIKKTSESLLKNKDDEENKKKEIYLFFCKQGKWALEKLVVERIAM